MTILSQKAISNWQKFATFPCKRNSKIPATSRGFKDAQFGQNVQAMLNAGYNPALACKMSGVIVIDVDYHVENSTAMEDLQKLEKELGAKLPKTLTQATASGKGRHFIFSDKGIISPKGKIGKYCDIKSKGYIMIAPSMINGRQYEIIDGTDENGEFIIAELPQVWLDYINKSTINSKAQKYTARNFEQKLCKNINIEKMFKNCRFLADCKENADCLSYPQWHSMITVLAQIENSDELIHSLSEPHPNYSFEETQKKIDLARQFGKPHTCKYISGEFSEICQNCLSATNKERKNYE